MKKFAFAFAAAVAAVLVTLVFAPSATAYPDVRFDVNVDRQVLYAGESFTATATSNVTCNWTLAWDSVTRQDASPTYVTTYVAPAVTRITRIPLDGTCLYASPTTGRTSTRVATAMSSWHRTIVLKVLPRSSGATAPNGRSGNLPSTGGPDEVVLFGGLALFLVGAGAVTLARRRAEDAELSGQTA
ncbi:MAG: hypothetical protein JWQ32_2645 [Marmoricola sp.]|nr:hypothetical protein [Marmoricola sp.]